MMNTHLELLEYLARVINCEYLSDLRCRAPVAAVGEALRTIPVQRFPAEQWQEAASYLIGPGCAGLDGGACRQRLLEHYPVRQKKNISRP